MLNNYLKIALRSLRKRKSYAIINVTGLAVGLACCLLIGLWVRDELSYDTYHAHADQIYRIMREWTGDAAASALQLARISAPIAPALEQAFPEVEETARIWGGGGLVGYEGQHYDEPRFYFADADLFAVFTIPFVEGNSEAALAEPFTVVLTETMARKYFGANDPLGKVLRLEDEYELRVTGVIEDAPSNTHFHYDFLASLATLEAIFPTDRFSSWTSYNNHATYVRLRRGADPSALEAKLPAFQRRHASTDVGQANRLRLQPITDIHLSSQLDMELEANGSMSHVYLFSTVALLVLLIACFNFMNLATARSAERAREVGLRKVLGAQRWQLIRQFLGEALLMAALSVAGAVVLAKLSLPAFNNFVGKEMSLMEGGFFTFGLALIAVTLVVGLVGGSYPALYLSRYQPATVFRRALAGKERSRFRAALVVAQFSISIVLMVGVGVVYQQLDYVQSKRLGFDEDRLVVLPSSSEIEQQFTAIRERLVAHPGVKAVTASQLVPSDPLVNHIDVTAEVEGAMKPVKGMPLLPVDFDFAITYGLNVVAGRSFSNDRASDSTRAFVLNETAVRRMGWSSPQEAIGKRFVMDGNSLQRRGRVIGVVEDFHFETLRERIAPLVLFIMPERTRLITVKIAGEDVAGTMDFLARQWTQYQPNYPFRHFFVNERFDQLYRAEQRIGQIFGFFAALAIFIGCLGLFGLATYATERRTKEIGIRKVLGASVTGIVVLLSKDVLTLVGGAFVIATPVAYFAMQHWLADFAYRVELGVGVFALAGVLALGIALLSVSAQSIRAALTDPVNAIQHE